MSPEDKVRLLRAALAVCLPEIRAGGGGNHAASVASRALAETADVSVRPAATAVKRVTFALDNIHTGKQFTAWAGPKAENTVTVHPADLRTIIARLEELEEANAGA